MKIFLTVIFFIITIIKITAQTLSVPETVDYINEKLEINKTNSDVIDKAKVIWEVSNNGKLTITRYWNNKLSGTYSVYLSDLEKDNVEILINDAMPSYSRIQLNSKDKKSTINDKTNDASHNTFYLEIFFKYTPDVAKQLKNAIVSLIKEAETNKTYRKKDPFDY
ncbi:MAG: hypothetical protein Q8L90_15960 [Bacteroidota bacterium]|nr:hypothetical protein [Bacteroidota bacterium]